MEASGHAWSAGAFVAAFATGRGGHGGSGPQTIAAREALLAEAEASGQGPQRIVPAALPPVLPVRGQGGGGQIGCTAPVPVAPAGHGLQRIEAAGAPS